MKVKTTIKTAPIEVPEWELTEPLFIRSMTHWELTELQRLNQNNGDPVTWAVARLVVKADGTRIFDDSDIEELRNQQEYQVMNRIFDAIAKHNGLDKESQEQAEKNS